MGGYEVFFALLVGMILSAIAAHFLSLEFRLPPEAMWELRQANAVEVMRERHRQAQAAAPPIDDRRWREAETEIDQLIVRAEGQGSPAVRAPGGEPRGEVPPLCLFAEMDLETFAEATVSGLNRPAQQWRTPRPRWTGEGIVVRVLANAAFLHGVECNRGPGGWMLERLPAEFVDRGWTLSNHRQNLGGGGLVTGDRA